MDLHFEVENRRRFLCMPRILVEPSYVDELRAGAALRALRRIGILSRLNRVMEEAIESVLGGTYHFICNAGTGDKH